MNKSENIDLLEGVQLRTQPASLGRRILAYLVDYGIVTAILYVLFIGIFFVGAILVGLSAALLGNWWESIWQFFMSNWESGSLLGRVVAIVLASLVVIFIYALTMGPYHYYFIYNEYKKGRTLGKKLFGMRIISLDNNPSLSLKQCFIRDFTRLFELLLVLPGLLSIALSKKNQRIGDVMSGTMVVYVKKEEHDQKLLYLEGSQMKHGYAKWGKANIDFEAATEYLKFAYPQFIFSVNNSERTDKQAMLKKASQIIKLYSNKTIHDSDDAETLLRYHAESCLQIISKGK